MRWTLVLILASVAFPQDGASTTVVAKKGTVRQTVERTGTLVPADAAELKLDLKAYRGELRLKEIIAHGSFVNEGDVTARIETKGIDLKLKSDKMALGRAEMALRHYEEGLRLSGEKDKEALERAELGARRAATQLRGYRDHDKDIRDESERLGVQGRKFGLENQKDELDQLEKMYGEDELVDATEEIVLKRSRRGYARRVAGNDLTERRRVYNKEFYYAWKEEDLERDARVKARGVARLRRTQEMAREKVDAELADRRYKLARKREKFSELEQDRTQFDVRAPAGGLLLHGKARGPWSSLKQGGILRNRTVFATIAQRGKYKVSTDVPEAKVLKLKSGTAAEITFTAAKDIKLTGRLDVQYLPSKPGVFKASVRLPDTKDVRLRPGLTCKVMAVLGEERDVIVLPMACVKDGKVKVGPAGGPFAGREVVTGLDDGKNIAIRDGVAEGEFVVVPDAKAAGAKRRK